MTNDRPSKKQRELLSFIDGFIKGNGYGPSYREIMRALNYKSVSTVAVHIDGLITKGKLIKHGRSARSLEVVGESGSNSKINDTLKSHHQWLNEEIAKRAADSDQKDQLALLKQAADILGVDSRQ